ncbi:unnamed protein product [Parnassius apollo]|uniref:(apollo) hypothetical protein n=1 Tax=Parnassius apollo TaxID=110799 RepID=A0A8S3YA71_PARAO|nr:unnamed protein product [Parnassius apollo]
MNKEEERIMRLFEEASTGSSIPDPFSVSDDGQYGSDGDYNPCNDKVSSDSSNSSVNRTSRRSKLCNRPSNRSQPVKTAPLHNRTLSSSSSSSSSDVDKTESLQTHYDEYLDVTLTEDVPRSHDDSITLCESVQSESILQTNTTQPVEEQQEPNCSSNITMQDPEPGPSNISERHNRPITPPATVNWEHTTLDIPEFNFDSTSTGVQFHIDENTSILDVFGQLFPSHIVSQLIEHTNKYGEALCNKNRPMTRHSRRYSFRKVDEDEFFKFLGLCLLQGQISVPKKRKLFTYSDILYYHPIFPYVMSQRRFEQILRCLYASDLNAKGSAKISSFIDNMCQIFQNCYKPEKELSLDESLLLFRGRLKFRQYMKGKKARYGIKFYELTTAEGFVLNIIMYTGKTDDPSDKGKKTENLVLRLMRPYMLKGHHLFMDNYYNSVPLSEKLLDLKTHTNGTLRANRKDNPKVVVSKKLKKRTSCLGAEK